MVVAGVAGKGFLNPVLACQDRQVRVLSDRGDQVAYKHKFDAAVVSISLSDTVTESRNSPILGYGLANGGIGVLELMRNRSQVIWSLDPI